MNLEVFDVTGQRIAALIDEVRKAGQYTVRFDGADLSAGVYVYRLTAANRTMVRKTLLIK